MSLLDEVAAYEDVKEITLPIPAWGNIEVLFRGLSFAALFEISRLDLEAAQGGDVNEAIKLIQATACDPETKELAFAGPKGEAVLRSKSYESILYCVQHGSNMVLGIDAEESAGKASSSTDTETQTTDA